MSEPVPAEFQNAPPWFKWEEASIILPLTRGYCTIIDAADWGKTTASKWLTSHTNRKGNTDRLYAKSSRRHVPRLHRVLMDTPQGLVTDHINGDSLDNRRHNLRNCTHAENARNRRKQTTASSPYKGVYPEPSKTSPWRARIWLDDRNTNIGVFKTAEDAARAYNEAALKHFGEFAYLNVVPDVP